MRRKLQTIITLGISCSFLLLAACDESPTAEVDPSLLTVGGTAQGIVGSIVLQNNDGDDLTLTESGTFTFATELKEGETYEVTLETEPVVNRECELANAAGTMADTAITDVTIVCTPFWGGPESLTTDASVGRLDLAFDIDGNAMAVWVEEASVTKGISTELRASFFDVTTVTWGDSVVIATPLTNPEYPQVAFDADGNAMAVWQQYPDAVTKLADPPTYDIRTARFDAEAKAWGDDLVISTSNLNSRAPQIAFDLEGNAMAIWYEEYAITKSAEEAALVAPSPLIRVAPYDGSSGTWGADVGINDSAVTMENAQNPQIAFDQDGRAIAVWEQAQVGDPKTNQPASILAVFPMDVRAARYSEGSWSSDAAIDDGLERAFSPKIAIDADGNALVTYVQYPDITISKAADKAIEISPTDPYAVFFDVETKTWQSPVVLDSGTESVMPPEIAFDLEGNAMAVWNQLDGSSRFSHAAFFSEGEWGADQIISDDTEGLNAQSLQVGFDIDGNAIATWVQYVVVPGAITLKSALMEGMWSKYTAGTWSTPESITEGNNVYNSFASIVHPYGGAMAMWVANTPYDLTINTYGP